MHKLPCHISKYRVKFKNKKDPIIQKYIRHILLTYTTRYNITNCNINNVKQITIQTSFTFIIIT